MISVFLVNFEIIVSEDFELILSFDDSLFRSFNPFGVTFSDGILVGYFRKLLRFTDFSFSLLGIILGIIGEDSCGMINISSTSGVSSTV